MRDRARRPAAPEPAMRPSPAADWTSFPAASQPVVGRPEPSAHARKKTLLGRRAMPPPSQRKAANSGERRWSSNRFRARREKARGVAQSRRGAARIGENRITKCNKVGAGADEIADRGEIMGVTDARNVEDFRPPSDALDDPIVRLPAVRPAKH